MVKKIIPVVPLDGDPDLERALYRALRSNGSFFAMTEAEVARVEVEQAKEPPGAYESDPQASWERSSTRKGGALTGVKITDIRITEELARAARSGKPIPSEVEARMHRDRDAAEQRIKR
jgi:hypothetical protein